MRTVLAAVGCAAALSCGPLPKSGPTLPAPVAKTYAPFASKADARAPDRAVILGTDEHGGALLLALAPAAPLPAAPPEAALVAAAALGKDPGDIVVPASDQPSALAATLLLAVLTGAPVDPAATVIGTVVPDGSIAPIDKLSERVGAAVASGKQRIGVPVGSGLAQPGVVEVATVHAAYQLLAKRTLPAAVPVPAADMAIDAETAKALETKYREWQQKLGSEWALLFQLEQSGRLPETLKQLAATAKQRGEDGERLFRAGQLPAAYGRMLVAWVYAAAANQTYAIVTKVQDGDVAGAIDMLTALDPSATTSETLHRIAALAPTTIGGHLLMFGAFEAALRGASFGGFAGEAIGAAKQYLKTLDGRSKVELGGNAIATEVVTHIAPVAILVGRATAELTVAQQELDFEADHSAAYTCTPTGVVRDAAAFQAAATAGLARVEAEHKITDDAARSQLAITEPDYLVAFALLHLPELAATWEPVPSALLALAAGELAYQETAVLAAKTALDVRTNAAGKIAQVGQARPFAALLATADRQARASARAARAATGSIPVQARLAYQLASVERGGELDDQINALAELWAATAFCQTAVLLAHN